MALTTHVTNRFGSSSQHLRNLTNPDDPDASSIDSTRLGLAADAAEGDFPLYAQVEYDDTDPRHIETGVLGVIAHLKVWSTQQTEPPEMVQFRERLAAIGRISSRKRITPTGAELDDTEEELFRGLSPLAPTRDEDL